MKFKIQSDFSLLDGEETVCIFLTGMPDEYYLSGGSDYCFNSAFKMPETKKDLISAIEMSINACIDAYIEKHGSIKIEKCCKHVCAEELR